MVASIVKHFMPHFYFNARVMALGTVICLCLSVPALHLWSPALPIIFDLVSGVSQNSPAVCLSERCCVISLSAPQHSSPPVLSLLCSIHPSVFPLWDVRAPIM